MSGISGAGRKGEDHLSFATATSNVGAYGSTAHRHVPEMERALEIWGGTSLGVSFTPHLVPMARGLVVTARARLIDEIEETAALDVLHDAYGSERFVDVVEGWPQSKSVLGTNKAHVGAKVDARNGWLVCSAAIDNLGKGAAGQALQNGNLALGLDENAGLEAIGVWP
jgi:N-acetyl-gamma-glutamyl-phosphate reductase